MQTLLRRKRKEGDITNIVKKERKKKDLRERRKKIHLRVSSGKKIHLSIFILPQ